MTEPAGNTRPLGAFPLTESTRGPTRAALAAEHLIDRVRLVDAGVLVGVFCGFDAQGSFLVRLARDLAPVPALSVIGLRIEDEGDEVIVSLQRGDPSRPVILGRALRGAQDIEPAVHEAQQPPADPAQAGAPVDAIEHVGEAIAGTTTDATADMAAEMAGPAGLTARGQTLVVDGQRVVLQGARQVELRCGEASIVLTAAGKILIRGSYVLSRSSGANRIKGAFVDIN